LRQEDAIMTTCTRSLPTLRDAAPIVDHDAPSPLDWSALRELMRLAPLADGYHFELLERGEVATVIALIARWFPEIGVGSASGYVDAAFYQRRVAFADAPTRDVIVATMRCGDEIVGVYSFEIDRRALAIHARIGVATPDHRGARLAQAGMACSEAAGRWLGMGIVYGMATLKAPHSQRAFERAGWTLVGIAPGLDRERVAPGVIKRVYEALYAKVLVDGDALVDPQAPNMTPRTRELFSALFGSAS
jgi:hypothetical protein